MSTRLMALGVAVLLLLAGGVVALGIGTGSGRASDHAKPEASTTTSTTSTTSTTVAASRDQVIAEVERFVSKTRGLAFKQHVPVTLLSDTKFKDRLLADAGADRAATDVSERVLRAVGLIGRDVHLYDVVVRFLGGAVVGFYDPKRHDLVLRAAALTPYARATLAHELTHALDDQWFGLDRPALHRPGNDEADAAFTSLAEGNAVRVQETYIAAMSRADRAEETGEERRAGATADMKGVPPVVPEILDFPYMYGPPFVRALVAAGGERRVDQAFGDPPATTADIADPKAWLAGRRPIAEPVPKADGKVIDEGIYGYSSLLVTLEPVVGTDEATRAAQGWAGDAYVAWDAGGGSTCVRAVFAMRTPGDLNELTRSLDSWATERKATVERGASTVGFTSCG